jgi:hypothetical protein
MFGEPSGAMGCAYGPQSGVDLVISTSTTPLNGLLIGLPFRPTPSHGRHGPGATHIPVSYEPFRG